MSLLSATIISGVYSFLTNVHSIIPLNYDYDPYKDCDLDHARWFAPSGKSSATWPTSITFDGVNCQAADDPKLRDYCQRNVSQSMANSGSNECASDYNTIFDDEHSIDYEWIIRVGRSLWLLYMHSRHWAYPLQETQGRDPFLASKIWRSGDISFVSKAFLRWQWRR